MIHCILKWIAFPNRANFKMLVSYTLKSKRDFKNQMFYSFYTVGFPAGCGWGFQTLCDPMHSSPPGSSVHGILQARILEWVAISSSRRSSQPRDQTHISYVSCIGKRILSHQHHLWSPRCGCSTSNREEEGDSFRCSYVSVKSEGKYYSMWFILCIKLSYFKTLQVKCSEWFTMPENTINKWSVTNW